MLGYSRRECYYEEPYAWKVHVRFCEELVAWATCLLDCRWNLDCINDDFATNFQKRKTGLISVMALCIDLILCNGILKNVFSRIGTYDVNNSIQLLISRSVDFLFPLGHTAPSFATVNIFWLKRIDYGNFFLYQLSSLHFQECKYRCIILQIYWDLKLHTFNNYVRFHTFRRNVCSCISI